jgi:ATP-dependent 26S proteasome regulatory subunit
MFTARTQEMSASLRWLDRTLEREILRLRARYQLSLDEFRGLYVSDEQVDRLLGAALPPATPDDTSAHPDGADPAAPRTRLSAQIGLTALEAEIVLLALAPEIDPKYETLYAYLNNDVTRKWPTLDLAQRLLANDSITDIDIAAALSPDALLWRLGVLERIDAPAARPSCLNGGFALAFPVTQFLLSLPVTDPRLAGVAEPGAARVAWDQLAQPPERSARLRRIAHMFRADPRQSPALLLTGRAGSGRRMAAAAICCELGMPMWCIDVAASQNASTPPGQLAAAIALVLRLAPAVLYLHGMPAPENDAPLPHELRRFIDVMLRQPVPVIVACEPGFAGRDPMRVRRTLRMSFDDHDHKQQLALWQRLLADAGVTLTDVATRELADRLALPPGQIRDAIATALDTAELTPQTPIDAALIMSAAREQTDQSVGNVALKVSTRHQWQDLVLPDATLERIQELVAAIQHRHVVYNDWGFAQRISSGTGVKALFSGASGTGKTMAAGIVANELGYDLYKIELSQLVSKYIGETEKNLDRVFRAVRAANAMLFIDEAEAILGKRSEVKDAHDRYANIEVAYLLQKLEDHDGIVILASNLKRNIDDAFARRMQYVIEFPLPDESHRELLWRGMFPASVPLAGDVDCAFLARQFPLAGGDIRNVALDAAFLAASNGRVIEMKQLIQAMARQIVKQGKTPSPADFREYLPMLQETANGKRNGVLLGAEQLDR